MKYRLCLFLAAALVLPQAVAQAAEPNDWPGGRLVRPIVEMATKIYEAITTAHVVGGLTLPQGLTLLLSVLFALKVLSHLLAGIKLQPHHFLQYILAFVFMASLAPALSALYKGAFRLEMEMNPDTHLASWISAFQVTAMSIFPDPSIAQDLERALNAALSPNMAWYEKAWSVTKSVLKIGGNVATMGQLQAMEMAISSLIVALANLALLFAVAITSASVYFFHVGLSGWVALVVALTPAIVPFVMLTTTQDLGLRPLRWVLQASAMTVALGLGLAAADWLAASWLDSILRDFCPDSVVRLPGLRTDKGYEKARQAAQGLCGQVGDVCSRDPGPVPILAAALAGGSCPPGDEGKGCRDDLRKQANRIIMTHVQGCALVHPAADIVARIREAAQGDPNNPPGEKELDAIMGAALQLPYGVELAVVMKVMTVLFATFLILTASPLIARALLPSSMWDNIDLLLKQRVLGVASVPVSMGTQAGTTTVVGGARAGGAVGGAVVGAVAGGAVAGPAGALAGAGIGAGTGSSLSARPAEAAAAMGNPAQASRHAQEGLGVMPKPE